MRPDCRTLLYLVAALALLTAPTARGESISVKPKGKDADPNGSPLPRGAIARLGTLRLRHGDFVKCVAFTRDGSGVVSGSMDGTLRLWDAATGKERRRFTGHDRGVEALGISPDGKVLASCGQDMITRLWDLATAKELHQLEGRGPSYAVPFSPDGKTLAVASTGITLWDVGTGRQIRQFGEPQKWTYCLAWSPDGKALASGGEDGVVHIWEPATGTERRRLRGHQNEVHSVSFSPKGHLLASAGYDGTLRLWSVRTGEQIRLLCKGKGNRVCSRLVFSPDGKTIAWMGGHPDNVIRTFEVATGKESQRFEGHQHWVEDVAFSPDGKTLASAGADSTVRLWAVNSGKELIRPTGHQGPVGVLALSPDGKLLACGGGPHVHVWDTATAKEVCRRGGGRGWVSTGQRAIAFGSDGKTLTAAARQGLCVWDVATWKVRHRMGWDPRDRNPITLSANGEVVAFSDWKRPLELVTIPAGTELRRFRTDATKVALSPDGKVVAAEGFGADVYVWETATGRELRRLPRAWDGLYAMTLSPDNGLLALGVQERGPGREIRVVHVATGEELLRRKDVGEPMWCLAFSPDARTLASAGQDRIVHVWEMATGQERGRLKGHQGPVFAMTFSADGKRLASGSKDTTALLWDLTGQGADQPPRDLTVKALNSLWDDLAGPDAGKAYQAVWALALAPKQAVPFLRARLDPVPAAEPKQLARLIADLDNNDFPTRTKARVELEKLGEAAEPALLAGVKEPPSAEVGRQLKRLLDRLRAEWRSPSAGRLRVLRAVEALEYAGTPEVRVVLRRLAQGAPAARLTQEATASLRRLDKKRSLTK